MNHTYFLTATGQLYVSGNNDKNYKLGVKTLEEEINLPKQIIDEDLQQNTKILEISSQLNHTIALTSQWEIMSWGINKFTALGSMK